MRISDWSSDVCSSDLPTVFVIGHTHPIRPRHLSAFFEEQTGRFEDYVGRRALLDAITVEERMLFARLLHANRRNIAAWYHILPRSTALLSRFPCVSATWSNAIGRCLKPAKLHEFVHLERSSGAFIDEIG